VSVPTNGRFACRKLTGYGDIVHCNYYIENKAGHLVNVAARLQFFFDSTTQVRPPHANCGGTSVSADVANSRCLIESLQINYSVWCIDEVLGIEMPSIPFKGTAPPSRSSPSS
jgi:hypothetical protein